jgi:Dehydratase family
MTRAAFENAMVSVMALGGSTNAVLHLLAMARTVRGASLGPEHPKPQTLDSTNAVLHLLTTAAFSRAVHGAPRPCGALGVFHVSVFPCLPSSAWCCASTTPGPRVIACHSCVCLSVSAQVGVPLSIDDFQATSDRVPFIADLKPSGKYVMEDLHKVCVLE